MNRFVRFSRFITVTLASVSLLALLGCNSSCTDISNQVLQPASAAAGILYAAKSGADVQGSCPALLDSIKNIPQGAATIRQVAQERFSDSSSTCVDSRTSTRWVYRCWGGPFRQCRAFPVTYNFCAAWENHATHDAGYVQAMNLSASLDAMFDKANQLCGQAEAGQLDDAYTTSRQLLNYITGTVQPDANRVSALACSG